MKPNYSIDIAINCFRPGGGMESYTFDLVRGLSAHGIKPTVFAAQIDTTVPEYRQVDTHHVNQKKIPKKVASFFLQYAIGQTPAKQKYSPYCLQS